MQAVRNDRNKKKVSETSNCANGGENINSKQVLNLSLGTQLQCQSQQQQQTTSNLMDSINSVATQALTGMGQSPTESPSQVSMNSPESSNYLIEMSANSNNQNTPSTVVVPVQVHVNPVETQPIQHQHQQQHQHQHQQQQQQLPIQRIVNDRPENECHKVSSATSMCDMNNHNPLSASSSSRLDDDDCEIIDLCNHLLEQTFEQSVLVNQHEIFQNCNFKFDYDEFTQKGIRKCVKFCMNLPGNNDLCTDDRAKLLKYGVYEIVLLRLAYRYNKSNDCLCLSNGSIANEQSLSDATIGLGPVYGQKFFKFIREFSKFNLNKIEFSILCAIKFFTNDRPLLIERSKVQLLQDKYLDLLEHLLEQRNQNATTNVITMSHIFLSFINLRGLDVLTAEKMLNVVSINERNRLNMSGMMNPSLEYTNVIEGYVSEVLHREFLNITNESLIEQLETPLVVPVIPPAPKILTAQNHVMIPSSPANIITNTSNNINISNLTLNPTHLNSAKILTMNTNKPQIIKLQPYVPQQNGPNATSITLQASQPQQQQVTQIQTNPQTMLSSSPMAKQVIYMSSSQSPSKSGKMIKLPNNISLIQPSNQQSTNGIPTGSELKSEPMEHHFPTSDKNIVTLQQLQSTQNGNSFVQIQQQPQGHLQIQQSPQHQQQGQQQQVLNLVLVTDGVNGGVSYLSLVPQN